MASPRRRVRSRPASKRGATGSDRLPNAYRARWSHPNKDPPSRLARLFWIVETLSYFKDGFGFIEARIAKHGPVLRTHRLGRPTVVISGPEACDAFVQGALFQREAALPAHIERLFEQAVLDLHHLTVAGFIVFAELVASIVHLSASSEVLRRAREEVRALDASQPLTPEPKDGLRGELKREPQPRKIVEKPCIDALSV